MGRRGEGTVYRRRDGRWSGQIRRPDGVRQTVYGRTEEEARERLADVRDAIAGGSRGPENAVPDLTELQRKRAAIRAVVTLQFQCLDQYGMRCQPIARTALS